MVECAIHGGSVVGSNPAGLIVFFYTWKVFREVFRQVLAAGFPAIISFVSIFVETK
jgi:hypothetical protein